MKNIVFVLLILCPNMDIIRTTIYDFSALKKKKKKKKILEKNTICFQFCLQMRKKRKNRQLVAFFEKSKKKVKILQVFPQFFELFLAFVFAFEGKN
jgi:hypothetical protein